MLKNKFIGDDVFENQFFVVYKFQFIKLSKSLRPWRKSYLMLKIFLYKYGKFWWTKNG